MAEFITTETMVLPTGMGWDNPHRHAFAVFVRWQGELGWTVTRQARGWRLSFKGRKWCFDVPARQRRFYYFPTYNEALSAALDEVDHVKMNGRTWAEWEASRG